MFFFLRRHHLYQNSSIIFVYLYVDLLCIYLFILFYFIMIWLLALSSVFLVN